MGTPRQELNMLFDTGSAETWVYSQNRCQAKNLEEVGDQDCPSGIAKFEDNQSSTFNDEKSPITIEYIDSKLFGSLSKDQLCFNSD